ncbi:hypothetical protein HYALB_00007249 [Hymenoscyphus albidus]|uniref:J domain-containing protein n=1 Tax=Hymenoscyphus albidus TaxID=595503 RepID=A0A9N9Q342_9HELO|nr:hypothetical protein HYALB_00007249 [Hymenoscyphus albidus]
MSSPLPPNPYEALGVKKEATLPEIRSAHRKLVLKCHPDKVQDAALKAVKQDEFQKVQQAYELLSDENRRVQYDEQVKLFELRKEMGRGVPTPRSNPFEYANGVEIRTAEPRANTYRTTKPAQPIPKSYTQPMPKVYAHPTPKSSSYEDFPYGDGGPTPRKTASYESTDRKRPSARDEERSRRAAEEERIRSYEKEAKRSSHKDKRKSQEKDKRRGSEEKHARAAYVSDDDSDGYQPTRRTSDKRSSRPRVVEVEERYVREEPKVIPLDDKWDEHKNFAAQYMQASRQKAVPPAPHVEDFRPPPPPLRRADTFAAPSSSAQMRHVPPPMYSDDEATPRRSAARKERKSSETPRARERSTKDRSRKSSPTHTPSKPTYRGEPYIVEPPSPPPVPRMPPLPTHTSAPAGLSEYLPREKVARSKTEYQRKEPVPQISRSHTYHTGDPARDRTSAGGSSRLKKVAESDSSDNDGAQHGYAQRRSHSPARQPHRTETTTRYFVDKGRAVDVHPRSDMRGMNDGHVYSTNRSPSPRGTRRDRDRPPPVMRSQSTSDKYPPVRVVPSPAYYGEPESINPVVVDVRPKMPPRESGYSVSSRATPHFSKVDFAPVYNHNNVIYAQKPEPHYSSTRMNEPQYSAVSGRKILYA